MTFGYNRDKFRVRSPVKSFRDLEVYQKTVQLSSEVESLGNTEMNKAAEAAALTEQALALMPMAQATAAMEWRIPFLALQHTTEAEAAVLHIQTIRLIQDSEV